MRIRRTFLLLFLLALYIGPMILCPSYDRLATPAEQNMTKDFQVSTDGDESSQSITSFSETLTDDTLFYPDLFDRNVAEVADSGAYGGSGQSGTWSNTQAKDGTVWRGTILPYHMNLTWTDAPSNIRGFDYSFYFTTVAGSSDLQVYDNSAEDWVDLDDITSSSTWYNGTLYNPDYWDGSYDILMQVSCPSGGSNTAYWDYAELNYHVMTLADADHYAESFADVSDWTHQGGFETGTDTDVGYADYDNSGGYTYFYTNELSLPIGSYYLEFRAKDNVSVATGLGGAHAWSGDSLGGSSISLCGTLVYLADSFSTYRYYFELTWVAECVSWRYKDSTNNERVSFDYLRISPAAEMGWQHSGSTTEGVSVTGGGSYSSDGDALNLTADWNGSPFEFVIDTTTTATALSTTYYQFLHLHMSDTNGATVMSETLGFSSRLGEHDRGSLH